MRGILSDRIDAGARAGITPAHAGNTMANLSPKADRRDHPRACGEYLKARRAWIWHRGSPPRMRGIRAANVLHAPLGRITPAHAGNTHAVFTENEKT